MLSSSIIQCLAAATGIAVSLCLALSPAQAQPDQASRPDAVATVTAYMTAREWVSAFDTPDIDAAESRVSISGATGVCVLLRLNGRIVGDGTDFVGDDLMLRRAVGRALSQLAGVPAVRDTPPEFRDSVGARVTMELEVAGSLTPVIGDTMVEVAGRIAPGLHGVAVRLNDQWSRSFPSQMRAYGSAAILPYTLQTVLANMGAAGTDLAALRESAKLTLYRFETIDLAQRSTKDDPVVLLRGDRVIPEASVNGAALKRTAERLVSYFMRLEWNPPSQTVLPNPPPAEPLGLRGWYRASSDQYNPPFASAFEQALASYALSRFAWTPGMDANVQGNAAALADRLLSSLADFDNEHETAPLADPAVAPMVVLAVTELRTGPPSRDIVRELFAQAREQVWQVFDVSNQIFQPQPDEAGRLTALSADVQALYCCAMVRLMQLTPHATDPRVVRLAMDTAWNSVDPTLRVSMLPWMGWAEQTWTAVTGRADPAASDHLLQIAEWLESSRIRQGQPGRPPDEVGALMLATASGIQATAQGLRPAAWLSRRLVDPAQVNDRDLPTATGRMLGFCRFLLQLAVEEDDLWAYQSPDRARGGLKNAPWDLDLPVSVQGLGLLVICDVIRGLQRLDGSS